MTQTLDVRQAKGFIVSRVVTAERDDMGAPADDGEAIIVAIEFTNGCTLSLQGSPQIGLGNVWGSLTTAQPSALSDPSPANTMAGIDATLDYQAAGMPGHPATTPRDPGRATAAVDESYDAARQSATDVVRPKP